MSEPEPVLCDWCQKYPGIVRWMGFRYCGACAQTLIGNKPAKVVEKMGLA